MAAPSAVRSPGPAGQFDDAAIADGDTIHDTTALVGGKCKEDDRCWHDHEKAGQCGGLFDVSPVLGCTGFVDLLGR